MPLSLKVSFDGYDVAAVLGGNKSDEVCPNHVGGTATCTEKGKCELCGKEYIPMIEHDTEIKVQATHWQPCKVVRNNRCKCAISTTVGCEIAERSHVREHSNKSQRGSTDKTGCLMRHLHASQSQNDK